MAYTVTPLSGVNFNTTVQTNTNSAGTAIPSMGPLGTQVFGSDGKRYVLCTVSSTIGNDTACLVNASTFVATANASGTYSSPVDVVSGDYAWFGVASV